ncbi:MAG: TatD family hydrolase [Bacteroidales bacterium]
MQLIDTHTHLYLPEFDSDRDEMVNRAVCSGVVKLFLPNIDLTSIGAMLSAADRYKDICYPMTGLHPTSVREDFRAQLNELERILSEHKFIAIGEIGIDLYWDKTWIKEQMDAFRKQVELAIKSGLPVAVHSRNAFLEVFSVLDEFAGKKLTGVFHAFSGGMQDAEKAIGMGFMLGIGGPVTFKNSRLDKIIEKVGINNIVLETDSPYLAPVPYRGKRNESSYIYIINKKIAEIFRVTEEESARMTFENSCRLFNI